MSVPAKDGRPFCFESILTMHRILLYRNLLVRQTEWMSWAL